jgi:hypothetical protein
MSASNEAELSLSVSDQRASTARPCASGRSRVTGSGGVRADDVQVDDSAEAVEDYLQVEVVPIDRLKIGGVEGREANRVAIRLP